MNTATNASTAASAVLGFPMIHFVDSVLLRHSNSQSVQDRLSKMGYYGLHWSISPHEERQNLIAKSYRYTKMSGWRNEPEKTYEGSFWNCGINEAHVGDECLDCGTDVEKFLKYAERIINERELYFDKEWNEISRPDWVVVPKKK